MAGTLLAGRRARFSETARSRPGLGEARRDRAQIRSPPPVDRRRLSDDLREGPAERPQAGEADVEADLAHAAVGLAQEEHRPLHAPALQVAMRGLAEGRPEGPDEVRLG